MANSRSLLHFGLLAHVVYRPGFIHHFSDQFYSTYTRRVPTHVHGKHYHAELFGGQYAEFGLFLEDVLATFSSRGIALAFVFDAYSSEDIRKFKRDTLQERMEETLDEVLDVIEFCKSGSLPRRGSLSSRIPMPALTTAQAKAIIKREGSCLLAPLFSTDAAHDDKYA